MSHQRVFHSVVAFTIESQLALKEALGRSYYNERRILTNLDAFLNKAGTDLTADTFVAWCRTQQHLLSGVRRYRMRVVRNLCLYRRRTQPSCFVPDLALFPPLHQPVRPHIFTEGEIARLLRATGELKATGSSPLRKEVYRLAIVLLYTSGLRRREVVRLTIGDHDQLERTLLIRASKFHKSRMVPLSEDGSRELDRYLKARRRAGFSSGREAPLLCHRSPGFYCGPGLACGLRSLLRTVGIRTIDGRIPRVHDFRHAFAVNALVRWYRAGSDVQAKLPFLAAYMGHVSIVSTQYYLSFLPILAESASDKFAKSCSSLVSSSRRGAP